MFNVDNYRVTFSYPEQGTTHCQVRNTNEKENFITSFAYAKCGANDQFNKNSGRKVALGRAVAIFPRQTRSKFWAEYFKARNGKY